MAEDADSQGVWLGLLKWSLGYVDGTVPSEDSPNYQAMSEEDKKFLEEVMKNGIIDEGARMKTILKQFIEYLESLDKPDVVPSTTSTTSSSISIPEIETLLSELQDIVEQIDYAKSFAAMGGIQFLIGCSSQLKTVPQSVRAACLTILATLCQNNPAVQYSMLEQGNIPKLINIYFADTIATGLASQNPASTDSVSNSPIRAKTMQALSCCIRNHHAAEKILCMNEQGRHMIENGLMTASNCGSNDALRRKSLFFLQALLTSDSADLDRITLFTSAIQYVAMHYLIPQVKEADSITCTTPPDLIEMALSMVTRILDQKKSVNAILDIQSNLVSLGLKRVPILRALEGEEKEMTVEELRLWETLMTALARAARDETAMSQ